MNIGNPVYPHELEKEVWRVWRAFKGYPTDEEFLDAYYQNVDPRDYMDEHYP